MINFVLSDEITAKVMIKERQRACENFVGDIFFPGERLNFRENLRNFGAKTFFVEIFCRDLFCRDHCPWFLAPNIPVLGLGFF